MTDVIVQQTYHSPHVFVVRIVDTIIGVIEALLAIRIVLQLLGANPASEFVAWLYGITDTLIGPFAGSFPTVFIGGFQIEFSTVFAMIVYALVGWIIIRLLLFILSLV